MGTKIVTLYFSMVLVEVQSRMAQERRARVSLYSCMARVYGAVEGMLSGRGLSGW